MHSIGPRPCQLEHLLLPLYQSVERLRVLCLAVDNCSDVISHNRARRQSLNRFTSALVACRRLWESSTVERAGSGRRRTSSVREQLD